MMVRKDKRALVVKIRPGVIEARMREAYVPKCFLVAPDFFRRFVINEECLMTWEMPNGKVAVGYVKPKDQ